MDQFNRPHAALRPTVNKPAESHDAMVFTRLAAFAAICSRSPVADCARPGKSGFARAARAAGKRPTISLVSHIAGVTTITRISTRISDAAIWGRTRRFSHANAG